MNSIKEKFDLIIKKLDEQQSKLTNKLMLEKLNNSGDFTMYSSTQIDLKLVNNNIELLNYLVNLEVIK